MSGGDGPICTAEGDVVSSTPGTDPRQWKLLHWASQPPTEDPLLHARMDLSSGKQENQRLRREASSEVSNTAQGIAHG